MGCFEVRGHFGSEWSDSVNPPESLPLARGNTFPMKTLSEKDKTQRHVQRGGLTGSEKNLRKQIVK